MSDDALLLRTVEENEPLDNKRGVTYRVQVVGGGGGSVDYSKTVQKTTTMPTADSSNAGDVYMYTGATDVNYTTNYIYKNITTTTSSSASATQTVGSGLSNILVDIDTLESFTGWTTDNLLQIFYTADGWSVDTTSLGVTYTGTPSVGDAITITYTAEVNTYAWTRVDVQPAPSGLPTQTGNAGKFLTTDGTDASWGDALVNRSTVSSSTIIVNSNWSGLTTRTNSVCIDNSAPSVFPNNSVVIGYNTTNTAGSGGSNDVIIGYKARGGGYSIAIGNEANASNSSIQIGKGTNSEMGTLCVSLWNDSAQVLNNHKLLDADGTIPAARHASLPSADGTYVLKLVISGGVPTLSWVAE